MTLVLETRNASGKRFLTLERVPFLVVAIPAVVMAYKTLRKGTLQSCVQTDFKEKHFHRG